MTDLGCRILAMPSAKQGRCGYTRGMERVRISLNSRRAPVLLTIIILLLLAWLVVMVTVQTVSVFFHLLLVFAGAIIAYRLFQGGRPT